MSAQITGTPTGEPAHGGFDVAAVGWAVGRWALLILAIGAVVFVVRSALRRGSAGGGGSRLDRDTRRAIKERSSSGDHVGAGDIAFDAGAYMEAAALYQRGGDRGLAASAHEAAGQTLEAVALYKEAGQHAKAADVLEKSGRTRAAAAEAEKGGDPARAAQLYLRSHDTNKAAPLFAEANRWREAGEAYEAAGDSDRAAEAFERHLEGELERGHGEISRVPDAVGYGRRAAAIFEAAGDLERAIATYEKAGLLGEAAERLSTTDPAAAAKLYLRAGQGGRAAKLFDRLGDPKRAALSRADAALAAGDKGAAAGEFELAGDFSRAAELFVQVGEDARAATAFERDGDYLTAAEYYSRLDEPARAAVMYERADEHTMAADIYKRLGDVAGELRARHSGGDYLEAGRLLQQLGRHREAVTVLGQVDSLRVDFADALMAMGDSHTQQGRADLAYQAYGKSLLGAEIGTNNLQTHYKMARCAEEFGDPDTAASIYGAIVEIDPYHGDVAARLTQLNSRPAPTHTSSGQWTTRATGGAVPASPPLRYEIIDEIARGGMGVVYRARDTNLNRVVAFKTLGPSLRGNDEAKAYFVREAQAVAALSHPNIVTVFDAGEQSGEFFMAMELLDGEDLRTLVHRNGALHDKLILFVLDETCAGLAYAHAKGIVHRDIKTSNLMLTRDRHVKIMDFGLAKFVKEARHQSKVMGTPNYMSPEQVQGKVVDFRSDLYSLGVTLFELATGSLPFVRGEVSFHHVQTPPPNPQSLNPAVSDFMSNVILRLMAKRPEDRFQSAKALGLHLRRAAGQSR